jgi:predicted RNA-binding Zn-ribbon protein involved in translation (DUF1610 family)
MGDIPDTWPIPAAGRTRVLLICPECGHEATEFADKLRAVKFYACPEDGCDYRFDLVMVPRRDFVKEFADACKRFYTAFNAVSWPRSGPGVR